MKVEEVGAAGRGQMLDSCEQAAGNIEGVAQQRIPQSGGIDVDMVADCKSEGCMGLARQRVRG